MKLLKVFLIIVSSGLFFTFTIGGCRSNKKNNRTENINPAKYKKTFEGINRYLEKDYAKQIKLYVKRHNWNMTEKKTGIWYEIYYHGKGPKVESGDMVDISYDVYLLDGTLCYSSDSLGTKRFVVGSSNDVESGLDEGMLMLHEGDKARFIFPPYRAHGLLGDDNKIPPLSIILYYVEVLKVYKK